MFSKYDVYTTVQSMYCYPDTDVLINKLDIHDKAELKQAEEEFTAVKQMALLQEPIKGRFTKTHLFRIHRFLFEDVYPFAGHIRKEQISKGDTMFYPPDLIDRELERVFKNIHSKKLLAEQDEEKQIQNLSQTMAELNIIHPFREGNGRSTRELIRCIRHAAIDAARSIRSRRKREISLEYLIEEKHYPFSTTDKYFAEQSGMTSYPLFVCGQMVLLESPELAAALSALSQMEQEIIFLYYFQRLTHREIGRRYGRAGNTTGRRIQMILRRLRAELEGLSYEPATSL